MILGIIAGGAPSSSGSPPVDPDGWLPLTFGSSKTQYGFTIYEANESFEALAYDRIEIEAYVYQTGGNAALGIGNQTTAQWAVCQSDGNSVQYRRTGGSTSPSDASGRDPDNIFDGLAYFYLQTFIRNGTKVNTQSALNYSPVTVGGSYANPVDWRNETLYPFVATSDISKVVARYRILSI